MCTFACLYFSPILVLCLSLLSSAWLNPIQARPLDDDAAAKSGAPSADSAKVAKPVAPPANAAATAGLTERERMLLDRVEQLERRVAELEAAHQAASVVASSPTANSASPATATITAIALSTNSMATAAPDESPATF